MSAFLCLMQISVIQLLFMLLSASLQMAVGQFLMLDKAAQLLPESTRTKEKVVGAEIAKTFGYVSTECRVKSIQRTTGSELKVHLDKNCNLNAVNDN